MRTKATVLMVILLSVSGFRLVLTAQSLADVARQEQAQRKTIKKPSKVLTNKDLGTGQAAATPATTTTPPAAAADASKPAATGQDKKPAEPAKDQAYWSTRAKGLQTQLDRDQT